LYNLLLCELAFIYVSIASCNLSAYMCYVLTYLVNGQYFQYNLRKPEPECQTILGFTAARGEACGSGDNQN